MSELRIGVGVDAHAFADDVPLVLAGVGSTIRAARWALRRGRDRHALTDALLGAAGLADIGALFPSSDERWRGADSIELLRGAYSEVRSAGYALVNADCVLVGQEPTIAPRRDEMRRRLANALQVEQASSTFARRRPTGSGSPVGAKARGRGGRAAGADMTSLVRRPARSPGAPERDAFSADVSGVHASQRAGRLYWGRLYDQFPDFQVALLDGDELVAEAHAVPSPGTDHSRIPAGWDEGFVRGITRNVSRLACRRSRSAWPRLVRGSDSRRR